MVARMMRKIILFALLALTLAIPGAQAQFPGYPPVNAVQIGHGSAAPPGWDFVLGSIASQNANNVAITGGAIGGIPNPVNAQDVATKNYVDTAAAGLFPHNAVRLATAAALPANTYANGTAGVGATLTANANGALSVDGVAVAVNDRVLVKAEATAPNNGIYVVTATGSAGALYVLTRAADANTIGAGASAITAGTYVFTTAGTTQLNTAWVQTGSLSAIGTSAINWTLFAAGAVASINGLSGPVTVQAGTGITVTTAAPNITVAANPVVISNFISGLIMTLPGPRLLAVSSGSATDSTNAVTMNVASFTKSLASGWIAGTGNGGLGNGIGLAASATYHVCLANNGGTPDYFFDTAVTCSNRPAPITDTKVRRIGSVKTGTDANFRAFYQVGDWFYYPATQIGSLGYGNASGHIGTDCPPGASVQPILGGYYTLGAQNSSGTVNVYVTDYSTVAQVIYLVFASAGNGNGTANNGGAVYAVGPPTNAADCGINIVQTASAGLSYYNLLLYSQGWIDRRGQDGRP
jgi:hypothetical protein